MKEKIKNCIKQIKIHSDIVINIEISIFIILLFLQDFALIKTSGFGIAALTIYLVIIAFKYKFFSISKFCLKFISVFYSIIILSSVFNNFFNIMQILRFTMIIFIAVVTFKYIEMIKQKNKVQYFYKMLFWTIVISTIYGIYQVIASKQGLPLFLNIFCNNPSYYVPEDIYAVYKGWNGNGRIYVSFYEPSAYAIFLINTYFFVMDSKEVISKKEKLLISILVIVNIIFTYSRSGWITFLYFIFIYCIFKIMKKDSIVKEISKVGIILLPLISVSIMSLVGLKIFNDDSSKARAYSSLYYLQNSFENVKSISFGHGLGSILNIENGILYNNYKIENVAHNGDIDIMYQLGIIIYIYIIFTILKYLKQNKMHNEWLPYASIFTLNCFGSMFCIESMISLICLIISFKKLECCNDKREEMMIKDYVATYIIPWMMVDKKIERLYKKAHKSYLKGHKNLANYYSYKISRKYNCYISPKAEIGENLMIPHPTGIVIGEGVKIGNNVTIYQNVTLGRKYKDIADYPVIGNNVIIYCNSVVIGDINIGDNSIVGCNSVVLKSIENDSIISGIIK